MTRQPGESSMSTGPSIFALNIPDHESYQCWNHNQKNDEPFHGYLRFRTLTLTR